MSKLKDFIPNRIRELEDSLEPLKREAAAIAVRMKDIQAELSELRSASRAIGLVNRLPALGVRRRNKVPVTIKAAILTVLEDYPEGLIALDILAKINERFDLKLVRPSLSPQLTRLKRAHKLINEGALWRLPPPIAR